MREIKFRAWDGVDTMMYRGLHDRNWYSKDYRLVKGVHPRDTRILTVMQYTDRKDKLFNDIYEGDLLQNESGRIAVVAWREILASFDCEVVKVQPGDSSRGFEPNQWSRSVVVIGNIYENSELLK